MKILCICSKGVIRSVATATELKKHGYDALAAGVDANSIETINMLCYWADKILLAMPEMETMLPAATAVRTKIDKNFTLGFDVWGDAKNVALMDRVKRELYELKLIASPFKYE
jgi:hypothetical protein